MSNSDENGASTSASTASTNAIDYLRSVYQNPLQPDNVRMRAAAIAIEYELPRLAVTATVNAGDFADQLEKAIERSRMIDKPMTNVSDTANAPSDTRRQHMQTSNGGKPMMIPDRRFRKW